MVTYLRRISNVAAIYTTGDSRLYWGVPSLCGCRDNSPYARSTPYVFGVDGNNISNFTAGTCVKKVSGFAQIIPDSDDVRFAVDKSHVGEEFIIKSVAFETFKCGSCMSKRPRSDGKKLVLKESELDQNPHCRGWSKINATQL